MRTCTKAGCTVADTGICLLSREEPSTCPNFLAASSARAEPLLEESKVQLPLPGSAARRFPPGMELGKEDAALIMRARYTHMVGVLGAWDAGKTCFLLSLYLMASRGALPRGYIFAGSQTLQGFEARARRIREWKGGPLPQQLADHTSLADPRQAAFLHLALRQTSAARQRFDVLLTDLPGEWSKSLVDRATTAERFKFLRRSDGIIIVIEGPLLDSKARHSELQRSRHLLERLVHSVGIETATPLVLLVSKYDQLNGRRPSAVDELEQHAKELGFRPEVVLCAAFSRTPQVVPDGLGVFDALEKTLCYPPQAPQDPFWSPEMRDNRVFSNFGFPAR